MRVHLLFRVSLACMALAFLPQSPSAMTVGVLANRGQLPEEVRYFAQGEGISVYFTPHALVLDLREGVRQESNQPKTTHTPWAVPPAAIGIAKDPAAPPRRVRACAVFVRFQDANPSPWLEARGARPTRFNYYHGNDPARWRTDVEAYSEVVYHDLWPGVDVLFRLANGEITYNVMAGPGVDPDVVRFTYAGANRITRVDESSWRIETPVAVLTDTRAPSGREGRISWSDGTAGVETSDNPRALLWSTFLGGSAIDYGNGIVLDALDHPFVTGSTTSGDFPATPGAYDRSLSGLMDAFIAKFNSTGDTLLWCTFLGGDDSGNGGDDGADIVLDSSGNPVVAGTTLSTDFPTTEGAYARSLRGGTDVFVAKLRAADGWLLGGTYLGGSGNDFGDGLALDGEGNPVVTGWTYSTDLPVTSGAYDTSWSGSCNDGFVAKLSASGTRLLWCTFLGGTGCDAGLSVALDSIDNPVVTGYTESAGFPVTTGAYDTTFGGVRDAFVAKLDSSGSHLLRSTFLGGSEWDDGRCVALDSNGNPVLTGQTHGAGFPVTTGAFDTAYTDGADAFVSKLDADLHALVWSTYLGGSLTEEGYALVLGPDGEVIVTGYRAYA